MNKLKARFGETTPPEIADEFITASDRCLKGVPVFREESFIGGFADLKTGPDGIKPSAKLSACIGQAPGRMSPKTSNYSNTALRA